ncbi:hypothetical protein ISCGN_008814 [Ixodes scapularis]
MNLSDHVVLHLRLRWKKSEELSVEGTDTENVSRRNRHRERLSGKHRAPSSGAREVLWGGRCSVVCCYRRTACENDVAYVRVLSLCTADGNPCSALCCPALSA